MLDLEALNVEMRLAWTLSERDVEDLPKPGAGLSEIELERASRALYYEHQGHLAANRDTALLMRPEPVREFDFRLRKISAGELTYSESELAAGLAMTLRSLQARYQAGLNQLLAAQAEAVLSRSVLKALGNAKEISRYRRVFGRGDIRGPYEVVAGAAGGRRQVVVLRDGKPEFVPLTEVRLVSGGNWYRPEEFGPQVNSDGSPQKPGKGTRPSGHI